MTEAARKVLDDCKAALDMLEDEEDEQRWRVLWAGAMALVRAVGHVLKNADGEENPAVRSLADSAWERWCADRLANKIFWEFIQKERNNILKEYRFNVHDSADIGIVAVERELCSNLVYGRVESCGGSLLKLGCLIHSSARGAHRT